MVGETHRPGESGRRSGSRHFGADFRKAFLKSLDYLHTTFDVLDTDFLPSVNMLATLTVFFFNHR